MTRGPQLRDRVLHELGRRTECDDHGFCVVEHSGLELQADADSITVTGRRAWKKPEGWTSLYRESEDATYELVLSHDNIVDLDKVQAELRDGVLRVALAKTEAVKPRNIAVS